MKHPDISEIITSRFDNLFAPVKKLIMNNIQKSRNNRIIAKTAHKSDIIIGAAIGYSDDQIKPFILSLKSSGYKGRLVLFVDKLDSGAVSFLIEQEIELIWQISHRDNAMPVYGHRYYEFLDFLRKEQGVKRIMLTDVRDVIFQGNPFVGCGDESLYVFSEDSSVKLGQCPYNSEWVLNLYGNDILKKISGEIIICSGVTIGGYHNILGYLDLLCNEMSINPQIPIADQGAHHVLIGFQVSLSSTTNQGQYTLFTMSAQTGSELIEMEDSLSMMEADRL